MVNTGKMVKFLLEEPQSSIFFNDLPQSSLGEGVEGNHEVGETVQKLKPMAKSKSDLRASRISRVG